MKSLLLALLMVGGAKATHDPIELRISTYVCPSPCSVQVIVRVEPHPLNRAWVLHTEMAGLLFSEGQYQLDGGEDRITQAPIWLKSLPPGDYIIVAVVYRQQKTSEAGRATQRVQVVG